MNNEERLQEELLDEKHRIKLLQSKIAVLMTALTPFEKEYLRCQKLSIDTPNPSTMFHLRQAHVILEGARK